MDIIYEKFRHWEYNCKNYLARLKQGASVTPKDMYMIQTYFLSDSDFDIWVLDIICESHICNLLQ